jgi:hypothetical protein
MSVLAALTHLLRIHGGFSLSACLVDLAITDEHSCGGGASCPRSSQERIMFGNRAVDAELKRALGLSLKELEPLFAAGSDTAEKQFMECCWSLWKANGAELVDPFVKAAFNNLPAKSRAVLFQRMLTIVYVAQESEIKNVIKPASN